MRNAYEGTVIHQFGGTAIASGGTVTATGADWAPYLEPDVRVIVQVGATPSGTAVVTLQQSAALSSGYSDVGTLSTLGSTGGTAVYTLAGTLAQRYVRLVATSTGGTVLCGGALLGKPRTVTN